MSSLYTLLVCGKWGSSSITAGRVLFRRSRVPAAGMRRAAMLVGEPTRAEQHLSLSSPMKSVEAVCVRSGSLSKESPNRFPFFTSFTLSKIRAQWWLSQDSSGSVASCPRRPTLRVASLPFSAAFDFHRPWSFLGLAGPRPSLSPGERPKFLSGLRN